MYKLEDFKQKKFCDYCSSEQKVYLMDCDRCPRCNRMLPKKIWRD